MRGLIHQAMRNFSFAMTPRALRPTRNGWAIRALSAHSGPQPDFAADFAGASEFIMDSIIYLVGLIVIVMFILSLLGLR